MAWSRVQGVAGLSGDISGASNQYSVSFGAAVSSGSLVVGSLQFSPHTLTLTVADDKSNSYTLSDNSVDATDDARVYVFFLGNIGNAPTTITVSFSASANSIFLIMDEFSGGAKQADPRDGHNIAQVTFSSSNGSGSALTTTIGSDLIWSSIQPVNTIQTSGAGSGFTAGTASSDGNALSEYLTRSSAGSVTATYTGNNAAVCIINTMAFKPPATATWIPPSIDSADGMMITAPSYIMTPY